MEKQDINEQISISWDEEDGYVVLYTPTNDKAFHEHIELTEREALRLYAFLSRTFDKL